MWIKKRPECNTILDVVLTNTGLSEDDFFVRTQKDFKIDRLDEAANLIKTFIDNKEPITVVADYDADGVCGAAIMKLLFDALGSEATIRLPRRMSEGYGLSEKIVDEINEGLLITVDNGIAAIGAIKKAKDKGLTVLVTDHHLTVDGGELPPADIIIDPSAIPNSADFDKYCGAALAYKLALELLPPNHSLRPKLLSIAAIATVADVMPLISENRLIVKEGLKTMTTYAGRTTGLGALLEICYLDKHLTAKNIGFKIGPILNAPGRLYDDGATRSYELLSFNGNFNIAKAMAMKLNEENEKRKKLKEDGLLLLEKEMEEKGLFNDNPLCIYYPGLGEGLVGLFAGSLAEKYNRPCFIFTDSKEPDVIKGSARTANNVHLKNLLDKASDVLYKYGGHAQAAGVSVKRDNFEEMKRIFSQNVPALPPQTDDIYYDLEISSEEIPYVMAELEDFAPFGEANPEIVFKVTDFELLPESTGFFKKMGNDGQTIKLFGRDANAIGFHMLEVYEKLGMPRKLNLIGNLSTNYFMENEEHQVELLSFDEVVQEKPISSFAARLQAKSKNRY